MSQLLRKVSRRISAPTESNPTRNSTGDAALIRQPSRLKRLKSRITRFCASNSLSNERPSNGPGPAKTDDASKSKPSRGQRNNGVSGYGPYPEFPPPDIDKSTIEAVVSCNRILGIGPAITSREGGSIPTEDAGLEGEKVQLERRDWSWSPSLQSYARPISPRSFASSQQSFYSAKGSISDSDDGNTGSERGLGVSSSTGSGGGSLNSNSHDGEGRYWRSAKGMKERGIINLRVNGVPVSHPSSSCADFMFPGRADYGDGDWEGSGEGGRDE
ncbi:hypothetical protein ABW19_dt0201268 [Dactylella cylindrospora]|nr:hypothetical protein ABW19_dt0201268 [Dactylella cylindrospora]